MIDNIILSFRQLSHLKQVGDTITFWLYVLNISKIKKGNAIEIYVFLLLQNGERETYERKVTCELQEQVEESLYLTQADFKCSLGGLTEQYSSLIFSHSEYISGVPDDEISLNPVLTDSAIKEGKLIDYSLPENKVKIRPIIYVSRFDGSSCEEEGTFKIIGISYGVITNVITIDIPLTNPSELKHHVLMIHIILMIQ